MRFDNTISEFKEYFDCACAETAIYLGASGQRSDHSFAPVTSIFYNKDAFLLPSDVYRILMYKKTAVYRLFDGGITHQKQPIYEKGDIARQCIDNWAMY